MGTGMDWGTVDITRWECVRAIRDRDWIMRIVWTGQDPGAEFRDGQLISGTAWFSFGPAGGRVWTFQRDLAEVTPDVTHHFVRLVIRFATAL